MFSAAGISITEDDLEGGRGGYYLLRAMKEGGHFLCHHALWPLGVPCSGGPAAHPLKLSGGACPEPGYDAGYYGRHFRCVCLDEISTVG